MGNFKRDIFLNINLSVYYKKVINDDAYISAGVFLNSGDMEEDLGRNWGYGK